MSDYNKIEIDKGIQIISVDANRFKANEMSIAFATPLTEKSASANAVLFSLLSHCSKEYPTLLDLTRKLSFLYGATVNASINKNGENQVLTLVASCLDDRFNLDSGSIAEETIKLMLNLAFKPKLDCDNNFFEEDVNREKRIIIEKLESEENEKRLYSLRQLEKAMFDGEPYAINCYGTIEQVEKLTVNDINNAWQNIIKTAKVQVTVIGCANINNVCDLVKSSFKNVERNYIEPAKEVFIPVAQKLKTVKEEMAVKQGKLLLGFRVNAKADDMELAPAMRSFTDVFGGGPYSKLFLNVREKLSLCYYCSARFTRQKSCIIIQCGCEEENMDKAVEEILNQLQQIKDGNFETELQSSKVGLSDAISSVNDGSMYLESWYVNQILDKNILSPAQSVAENEKVTKEQIKECANLVTLDTIYKLVSNKEAE